jgi:hypothetical protein
MKNINIFDAILNIAAILNFHDWQQNLLEIEHIQKLKHFIQPEASYQ